MNNPTNRGMIRTLRELVPKRSLTWNETLWIVELQANRLLELSGVTGPHVPSEIVSELPRVNVRQSSDIPTSGMSYWQNGQWQVLLNATEPYVRQRYSLMHEAAHVVNHGVTQFLYGNAQNDAVAYESAERAADHFAACVLMPKRWLKAAWFASGQDVARVAAQFDVSPRALSVRLWHLGMSPDVRRCAYPIRPRQSRRTYFRAFSLAEAA